MYLFYLKLCHDYNNNINDGNNNENNNYNNDNSVNFIINFDNNNYNSNAHNNYYDNYMTITTTTYNGYDDYDISFTYSDDEYGANLLVSLNFVFFSRNLVFLTIQITRFPFFWTVEQ